MAFAINMLLTYNLSKSSQWAWRLPIIIMQIYPFLLFSVISMLPETPRWYMTHSRPSDAKKALVSVFGSEGASDTLSSLKEAHEIESKSPVSYADMLRPSGAQFHPTMVTVMGQVNQALTGYGAVSVYGPQIFELLGFTVRDAEYLTLGNYIFYLLLMTAAWMLIDRLGRRFLMVSGSFSLSFSFLVLTLLGGLAMNRSELSIPLLATGIPGTIVLYVATGIFGITWLSTAWLIPTEIYPSTARAQGAAISVIIWGLANFAVTLLTPIGFNNLKYWLFLVFAGTNLFAGWWTWMYSPESGGRSFEDNQEFFVRAKEEGTWVVRRVEGGKYLRFYRAGEEDGERAPLLDGVRERLDGVRERVLGGGEG
jgi:Sugar (and other) transporter